MDILSYRVHVGEKTREEIVIAMPVGSEVLYVHHYGMPHGYVEVVTMHPDNHPGTTEDRRFIVIDSYCSHRVTVPQQNLKFVGSLPFDNHVWGFFEVLA
jgi:hypothetical protein